MLQSMKIEAVEKELAEIEATYKEQRKSLRALLKVLQSGVGTPDTLKSEQTDDAK